MEFLHSDCLLGVKYVGNEVEIGALCLVMQGTCQTHLGDSRTVPNFVV